MSAESENKPVSRTVEAVYEDGFLKPKTPLLLPNGTPVHATIISYGIDPLTGVIGIGERAEGGADSHDRYIYVAPVIFVYTPAWVMALSSLLV